VMVHSAPDLRKGPGPSHALTNAIALVSQPGFTARCNGSIRRGDPSQTRRSVAKSFFCWHLEGADLNKATATSAPITEIARR
jgi:hypothetical protein